MTHYDYTDIAALAATAPDTALRLHWEGQEGPASRETPATILASIEAGEYTQEDFDQIGYCVTEEDYILEQSESFPADLEEHYQRLGYDGLLDAARHHVDGEIPAASDDAREKWARRVAVEVAESGDSLARAWLAIR